MRSFTRYWLLFLIWTLIILVAVPTVHSYLLYRKLRPNDGTDQPRFAELILRR